MTGGSLATRCCRWGFGTGCIGRISGLPPQGQSTVHSGKYECRPAHNQVARSLERETKKAPVPTTAPLLLPLPLPRPLPEKVGGGWKSKGSCQTIRPSPTALLLQSSRSAVP